MKRRGVNLYLIFFLAFIIIAIYYSVSTKNNDTVETNDYYRSIEQDQVVSVEIKQGRKVPTGQAVYTLKDGSQAKIFVSDVNEIQRVAVENDVPVTMDEVEADNIMTYVIIGVAILFVLVIFMSAFNGAGAGGGGGSQGMRMMNFGKSRAQLITESKYDFNSVAGLEEEKNELEEIVDFLKNPAKFTEVGARIPKGILLEGLPGTGKTLLAKAIAGEAKVPFLSISGSDFVEMFVGVGASRVRDLFAEAKKNSPCVVFIDEIDAVARKRGAGLGGSHDEREQTLNQMLVEMDGFGENEGIIVLAATNRVDILDPAILRPGRFDRKIAVSPPDVKGREEILGVHSKNKPLAEDVDLKEIAKKTVGFTGADLENLLNESAIVAARAGRKFIVSEDIKKSFIKVAIGTEKKSRVISDEEKRLVAYHEAGHAILFHKLPDMGPVYMVSIIPTGGNGVGGYTMPLPEKDDMFESKTKMLHDIMVSLGGRIAEEIVLGDILVGAGSDIKKVTSVARKMVTRYGMSENLGAINYENEDSEVFIGRDLGHTKGYSEKTAAEIDDEVRRIVDDCYKKAKDILLENRDKLDACAALLLEKERISRDEFEALFE